MKNNKLRIVIDARLSALHGTPESKERIMNSIRGETVMKRKMRLVPVIAALVILALSTIALAMSTNLFGLFTNHFANEERNASLKEAAENAVLSTNEPASLGGNGWVDFISTFFDGQRLMVAYELTDTANITETWQPTKDELDQMSEVPNGMLPMFEQQNDNVRAFYDDYNAGIPHGIHVIVTSRLDHTYTDDGVDLMFTDSGFINENGMSQNYILFDVLPEEIKKRDAVSIKLRFSQTESWYWFDGEKLFENTISDDDAISVMLTAVKSQ